MKFGLGSASAMAGAMQGFAGMENQKLQYQQDQNKQISDMMSSQHMPFDQAHAIVTNDVAAMKKLGLYHSQPDTTGQSPTSASGAQSIFSPTSSLFPAPKYGIQRYLQPPDPSYFVVPPISPPSSQVSAPPQTSVANTPGSAGNADTSGGPGGTAGTAGALSGSNTSPTPPGATSSVPAARGAITTAPQPPPVSTGSADGNPPGNWFGIDPSTGTPYYNPNGAGLGSNQQYGKELTPRLGKGHFGKAITSLFPYAIGSLMPGGIVKGIYPNFLGPEGDALARRIRF